MYDISSIALIYPNGLMGDLSNICYGNGRNEYATIMDLQDAVEDSANAAQLVKKVSSLNLIDMDELQVDRDTDTYTRLIGKGPLGNIYYLKIRKVSNGS